MPSPWSRFLLQLLPGRLQARWVGRKKGDLEEARHFELSWQDARGVVEDCLETIERCSPAVSATTVPFWTTGQQLQQLRRAGVELPDRVYERLNQQIQQSLYGPRPECAGWLLEETLPLPGWPQQHLVELSMPISKAALDGTVDIGLLGALIEHPRSDQEVYQNLMEYILPAARTGKAPFWSVVLDELLEHPRVWNVPKVAHYLGEVDHDFLIQGILEVIERPEEYRKVFSMLYQQNPMRAAMTLMVANKNYQQLPLTADELTPLLAHPKTHIREAAFRQLRFAEEGPNTDST